TPALRSRIRVACAQHSENDDRRVHRRHIPTPYVLGARPRSTGRRAAGQRVDARVRESQQQTWEGMMAVATMERERWTASETARASRTSVGGLERWLSMVAGGALAAYGFKRRSMPGGAAALAGAALLYWGATGHSAVKKAIGRTRRTSGHA